MYDKFYKTKHRKYQHTGIDFDILNYFIFDMKKGIPGLKPITEADKNRGEIMIIAEIPQNRFDPINYRIGRYNFPTYPSNNFWIEAKQKEFGNYAFNGVVVEPLQLYKMLLFTTVKGEPTGETFELDAIQQLTILNSKSLNKEITFGTTEIVTFISV